MCILYILLSTIINKHGIWHKNAISFYYVIKQADRLLHCSFPDVINSAANAAMKHLSPVVQSILSFTGSLVIIMLTVLLSTMT